MVLISKWAHVLCDRHPRRLPSLNVCSRAPAHAFLAQHLTTVTLLCSPGLLLCFSQLVLLSEPPLSTLSSLSFEELAQGTCFSSTRWYWGLPSLSCPITVLMAACCWFSRSACLTHWSYFVTSRICLVDERIAVTWSPQSTGG